MICSVLTTADYKSTKLNNHCILCLSFIPPVSVPYLPVCPALHSPVQRHLPSPEDPPIPDQAVVSKQVEHPPLASTLNSLLKQKCIVEIQCACTYINFLSTWLSIPLPYLVSSYIHHKKTLDIFGGLLC